MTFIVLGFVAVVGIIFVCIIIGKSVDEKEHDFIGKDEVKDQKEEAEVVRESPGEWDCER
ncbi:hypothetical protein [Enterococcus gallinarum]|uniref:Uncharacterized protein n=1 Tax=Enterococcus gallinarum TaxID=1353 RepID=A0A376H1Z3_ENTGA|nr:hypothetical protein [Enterococcus gallinarum]STD71722.1 Uncharacterised protein [Enterococcus gallinarum]STD83650.1 Uncharacterised protein [Enterococcus gallinarum]